MTGAATGSRATIPDPFRFHDLLVRLRASRAGPPRRAVVAAAVRVPGRRDLCDLLLRDDPPAAEAAETARGSPEDPQAWRRDRDRGRNRREGRAHRRGPEGRQGRAARRSHYDQIRRVASDHRARPDRTRDHTRHRACDGTGRSEQIVGSTRVSLLEIHVLGSPILRQETKPVERMTDELRRLADDMFETMHAAKGIGLAAPQIGRLERLFVADVDDQAIAVFNPEIVSPEG